MDKKNKITFRNECSDNIKHELNSSLVLKSAIGEAPIGITLWNKNMLSIMCNEHILDIFNIKDSNEFLERFFEFSPEFQPNGILSSEMAKICFAKALKDGKHVFHWLHLTPNGTPLPVEVTLIKIQSMPNEEYVLGYIKDLRTDFAYEKIKIDYDFYFVDQLPKSIFMNEISDLSHEWFFSIDLRSGNFHYYDYGNLRLNGISANTTIAESKLTQLDLIHKEDIPSYLEMIENTKKGIYNPYYIRLLDDNCNYRYHRINCKRIADSFGNFLFIVGKGIDIHEQRVFEDLSQKDLLTDCYNKISAQNIISEKLTSKPHSVHTLFIVDIDNFKSINDNLGHYFGDEVLKDISAGLKTAFRDIDVVARIGGDEFIIFVENLSDMELITKKAEKILEVYRKSYSGEYKDYSVSGSIGIALYPRDGSNYEALYQNADKALHQAKMQGKNRYTLYSADLNIGTTRSITKIENANRIASSFFDYELISAVFNLLYEKNGNSDSINLTLSYLCQKYNADRSYIFESLDNGKTYNNTFEYCKEGISSEIDNLQAIPKELFVDFIEKAHNDIIYSNNLRETLEIDEAFKVMAEQGILSFVHAQIKRDNEMTFFIGLDDCTKTRVWTEREINSLQYIGKLLSIILQGTHLRDELKELAISNRNSADILDNSDSIVYVSDLENYDLLYLNGIGKRAVGILSDKELAGKKCYAVLQGKTEPCEFCTNHLLNEDEYYEWSYHNKILDKTYLLKDKLMFFNGKLARLEIATDISKVTELEKTLKDKLADEYFLMNCIKMLHSGSEPHSSIYSLLETVSYYYEAERAYIFEKSPCGNYISNTYEFCVEGREAYKDSLQNLPLASLNLLLNQCETHEVYYMHINDFALAKNSLEYKLMQMQKLENIIVGAIRVEGKEITGFVGVDNPQKNQEKTSIMLSIAKFIATFLDETELIAKLNKLSYYDILTNVKNRHSYGLAIKEIDKSVDSLGVLYIDIRGLSAINDAKGIDFGDSILINLANILSSIFKDRVFRVGGDEFVIVSTNISEADFEKSISLLKEKLSKEKDFKTSMGYTWNKNFRTSAHHSHSLHEGKSYAYILLENLEMEIANGKYIVYLQPQMNLLSGKVESAEALVRRLGANNTLQAPAFFVPFYEKEGIISKIDEFVLERVCKAMKAWKDNNIQALPTISVNCSRMTVSEKDVVEKFSKVCDKYGVDRSKIVIEITETINGISEAVLAQIIRNFSEAGFLISLDDFGSGYSNLNSLVVSDFDEIKIDMKIIDGIHKDKKCKALTQVAISLCDSLDHLTSVAEGVEEKSQHDILCEMGCKVGQGYYYAKPMPIDEFTNKYL